ncbi:glutamate receptor ionotropic, NMDA 2B-like isoform X4 [Branchiostoma lanceolatum]|uniref:glutamate receptor ionotropic, NMDA 2B-like isoform X4 n=1 Tax=Branchiostoma lanceolatum TaxID=7740 RepID=UPI0034570235
MFFNGCIFLLFFARSGDRAATMKVLVGLYCLTCMSMLQAQRIGSSRRICGSDRVAPEIKLGGMFVEQGMVQPYRDAVIEANYRSGQSLEIKPLDKVLKNVSPENIVRSMCEDLVKKGVNAVIYGGDEDNVKSTLYVKQIAGELGMPILMAGGGSSEILHSQDNPFYPLLLRSSIAQQAEVMVAVLKLQRWYRFSVVTSEMPGHRLFQKTLRDMVINFKENEEKGVWSIYRTFTLNVHPTSTVQDVKSQLAGRNMSQVILLYCSKREAKTIFQAAGALGYTSEDYVWIAAESVIGDFTKLREAPPQYPVGLLSLVSQSQKYNKEATIRTGVLLYMEALRQYIQDGNSVSDLQTYNCKSIRGSRSSNATKLLYRYLTSTTIEDLDIKFNEDGTTTISTFDIMNVDGMKLWERVGSWNKDSLYMEGVTWPGNKAYPPDGISKDKHIRIVAVLEHPFITATEPDITGECHNTVECKKINRTARGGIKMCCTGFCIDLLKELARDVMFSYDLYLVPDNKHGKYEKGKWTGCIGELVKGHAQMALGSITITKERATAVDFSMPFVETGISVMTRRRKGVVPATAFLEPFDVFAWMAMFAVCLSCVAFTVMAFEFFSPEGYAGNLHPSDDAPPRASEAGRFTVGKAFWLLWALIFNNSVPVENPRGATSKYMITFWAFFAVIFLATYTANLAAFMIQEEYTDSITGLTDEKFSNPFAHSFRFGTKPNGSTEAFISKNFRRMHEYMMRYNQPSVNAAIQALKGGTLDAFIYDAAVLNYEAGKDEGCQLRTIGHGSVFATTGYGIGFPKNSEWVDDIDLALLSYFANGKLEELHELWLTGSCNQASSDLDTHPLGIENTAGVFYLLLAAIVLSIVILILEHFFYRCLREPLRRCEFDKKELMAIVSRGTHGCLKGEEVGRKRKKRKRSEVEADVIMATRAFAYSSVKHSKPYMSELYAEDNENEAGNAKGKDAIEKAFVNHLVSAVSNKRQNLPNPFLKPDRPRVSRSAHQSPVMRPQQPLSNPFLRQPSPRRRSFHELHLNTFPMNPKPRPRNVHTVVGVSPFLKHVNANHQANYLRQDNPPRPRSAVEFPFKELEPNGIVLQRLPGRRESAV